MKRVLLIFLVLASFVGVSAQKKVVYVEPFTADGRIPADVVEDIRARVYNNLVEMGRVEVVDGQRMGQDAARAERADFLIRGNLSAMKVEVVTGKKEGDDKYEANINGSLSMLDVHNGASLGQQRLGGTGSSFIRLPTLPRTDRNYRKEARRLEDEAHDNAINSAIRSCGAFVSDMIDDNVKIEAKIAAITEVKKDEVRGVTINKGTYSGVSKGERFTVSVVKDEGNYPVITKIGELRVKEQPQQNSALCKVTSGKKEIKQALDAGVELQVVSRKAKMFD